MKKRVKKLTVKPEQGRDWLERSESGESVPHIADDDGYDVRTIRKHIELAKQEREVATARAAVLRNALQQHYGDLRGFAERLLARIEGRDDLQFSENDEYFKTALKQHLPRSPIWPNLNKHERLLEEIAGLKDRIKNRVEFEVDADTRLKSTLSPEENGVIPGIKSALLFQVDRWSQGYEGLNVDENLVAEPAKEEEFVELHYGFSRMNLVRKEHVATVREALKDFESSIKQWGEYLELEKECAEDRRVKQSLKDELVVIKLKRIVPGRCRFCPL